ncbi:ankyrin repeat protein [Ectocarpus siliculosus]|uniref:Ankyrin repeat protein n=1 Tax=Ectocarpus siliculosus TaxID=2880 RepID=D7G1U1_ECTSI|nr:ankyrin repeat protein [Ectocarpus siliculosus]|eukprot:CBJ48667.1 ankyrin repeat protein [Ectocarpus siliculosus]
MLLNRYAKTELAENNKAAKETMKGEGQRVLDLMFDTRWPHEMSEWLAAPLESAVVSGHEGLARKLVQAGAKVGGVALHETVRRGHIAMAELLLENGASVHDDEDDYGTPLHAAAEGGSVETARLLLLNGADIDYQDGNHSTPLRRAITEGHISMVEALLAAGADLTVRLTEFEVSALDFAALSDHVEIVRMLIDHGMEVHRANSDGRTALHYAARGNTAGAIDVLVGAGADIQARDTSGSRPLHWAAEEASPEASLALLNLGAEVNAQTISGETALHYAAAAVGQRHGSAQVVDLLLRWGADETIVSKQGETAADSIGTRRCHRTDPEDDERARSLLARAPADRAWRRRGLLVLCRAHPDRLQLGGDLAGLVAGVGGLEEVGVFRTIVLYL